MSWPSCILDKLRKAPVVILTIGGSEKLIWTYLFFTNNIYVNTHVWNIWKNLHATCIVIRSSSAPWRPGTSARHRRGIPWSLQFFLLNAVWNKIYICITWMTFEYFNARWTKVFFYGPIFFWCGNIPLYVLSGLYCLKLDHFQTWAEFLHLFKSLLKS